MVRFFISFSLLVGLVTQAQDKPDYINTFPAHFEYISQSNNGSEPWGYWHNTETGKTGRDPDAVMSDSDRRVKCGEGIRSASEMSEVFRKIALQNGG